MGTQIQEPRERYAIIDLHELTALCGFDDLKNFQRAHCQWVEQALLDKRAVRDERAVRDDRWSESIAVGSLSFVENVKRDLGSRAANRAVEEEDRFTDWGYKKQRPHLGRMR